MLVKIIFGAIFGAILGFIFPYGIAFLNLFPFLRHDTQYETLMLYMFLSALFGAVFGGVLAYRKVDFS